jgi:hypothetical protein
MNVATFLAALDDSVATHREAGARINWLMRFRRQRLEKSFGAKKILESNL